MLDKIERPKISHEEKDLKQFREVRLLMRNPCVGVGQGVEGVLGKTEIHTLDDLAYSFV